MADRITVHFTPTPQDYVKTYRTLQFRSLFTRIVYGALGVLGLCLLSSTLAPSAGSNVRLWPIPIAILFFLALAFMLPGYSVGRRAKGNEQLLAQTGWEVDDLQLHVSNQFVDAKYEWGFFQGLIEDKEYFYLRHSSNKRLYNFIPKRAFTSAGEMQAFRELFKKHSPAGKGQAAPGAATSQ